MAMIKLQRLVRLDRWLKCIVRVGFRISSLAACPKVREKRSGLKLTGQQPPISRHYQPVSVDWIFLVTPCHDV